MQYTELNDIVDEVAERALGMLAELVGKTRLKEHPGPYLEARELLANLLADHEAIIRTLRVDLETCREKYHVWAPPTS